jgi:hypothetical protein
MPVVLSGTNGVTFPDSSLQAAAASPYVLKNRIINGDMRIDQRNAGASVTPANAADTYATDRWGYYVNQASKITAQQSTTAPVGFNYSLKTTSSSAYTIGAGDLFLLSQQIEGYNVADLGFGTANAKTFTLSFWVYSSLTGTFGGSFMNSAQSRSYPFTYTISSANTWEYKTITATADTTGTWLTTNGRGLSVFFQIGTGSSYVGTAGSWANATYFGATGATNLVATNGATFYITGVQLEQNTSATPFERRLYGQELALCQRYYAKMTASTGTYTAFGSGFFATTTKANMYVKYPASMRTSPTISQSTLCADSGTSFAYSSQAGLHAGTDSALWEINITGTATQFRPCLLLALNSANAYIDFSAEL